MNVCKLNGLWGHKPWVGIPLIGGFHQVKEMLGVKFKTSEIMKFNSILILVLLFSWSMLSSCESDDEKEHSVRLVVYSNTECVPIRLSEIGLVIKDYWESSSKGKSREYAEIVARCDDPTVLITAEIYVNGKLRANKEGNGYVKTSYQLK
jgi:hypothetical protein